MTCTTTTPKTRTTRKNPSTSLKMASVWMYNRPTIQLPYRDEVDKFIEAAKKDAITKKVPGICCPYTLMDVKGKTKDGLKSRHDLVNMKI